MDLDDSPLIFNRSKAPFPIMVMRQAVLDDLHRTWHVGVEPWVIEARELS